MKNLLSRFDGEILLSGLGIEYLLMWLMKNLFPKFDGEILLSGLVRAYLLPRFEEESAAEV